MTKAYSLTTWRNDTAPALNQTNLNKESRALDEIDNRVVELYSRTANLEGYQTQAQQAVTDARAVASQMATDAQAIKQEIISQAGEAAIANVNKAKSWAIGEGDPQRADQAINNSKYFAEQAEQSAVNNGYVHFLISDNGHLLYIKTRTVNNLDFVVRDNTNLFVVVNDGN